jgi:hypothetical protein
MSDEIISSTIAVAIHSKIRSYQLGLAYGWLLGQHGDPAPLSDATCGRDPIVFTEAVKAGLRDSYRERHRKGGKP